MESHTRQAICFNYVNHFILFSNICKELQATAGQNRMWKTRGWDRERLRKARLVLEVTYHMSTGRSRRLGHRSPRKGIRMQGGKWYSVTLLWHKCLMAHGTKHSYALYLGSGGEQHPKRYCILVLPDVPQLPYAPLFCWIQYKEKQESPRRPQVTLPPRCLMTRLVLGAQNVLGFTLSHHVLYGVRV